ncbi:MAG: HEAT repeat domain-containing protein [Planctomycetota bacterium]
MARDDRFRGVTRVGLGSRILVIAVLVWAVVVLVCIGCNGNGRRGARGPSGLFVGDLEAEAGRIIAEGLGDANPLVRIDAIEAVAATRQIRLVPQVRRMLRDEFEWVRFAAALAMGDLEYSLAGDDIAQLLGDVSANVRIAAAYALYRLGSSESFEIIRNGLVSDAQTVRANAALLLGKSGDKRALRYLWWALGGEDSDYTVKLKAAEAIGRLGDEQIFPKLWATVLSAYVDDRIMAIQAMGSLGSEKAREVLVTKLEDEVLLVRLAAAEQLGKLGERVGQRVVSDVFTKDLTARLGPEVRQHALVFAAQAIGEIGTGQLTRFLPRLLKDQSKAVRLAAARAFFVAQRGHERG